MKRKHSRYELTSWRHPDFRSAAADQPEAPTAHVDKKTAQLCAQAERTISRALDELGDPRLPSLLLLDVQPYPNAGHLLARIAVRPGTDLQLTQRVLEECSPHLRAMLAHAITRKRAPALSVIVVPEPQALASGEEDSDES